jgi:NAD+ kinase
MKGLRHMRIAVVGKNPDDLLPHLRREGFEVVPATAAPDLIVAHGGDGSLIGAEASWPGVPKLGIRDTRSCDKCPIHSDEAVFARLAAGDVSTTSLMKLLAEVDDHRFLGVNDVLMRNSDIRSAVRFCVSVNGERATDEIIGDGLVVSTPFGSSAYFRSISNTTFRTGIGLAFNNCTEFFNHLVLREEDRIVVDVVRGPAQITADNDPAIAQLASGASIRIRKSELAATVLALDTLRCPFCRYRHSPRRRF